LSVTSMVRPMNWFDILCPATASRAHGNCWHANGDRKPARESSAEVELIVFDRRRARTRRDLLMEIGVSRKGRSRVGGDGFPGRSRAALKPARVKEG
jgi:hypothetical protein